MIDIRARASELKEQADSSHAGWRERLATNISTQEGWRELLDVMAEHPGYSPRNLASVLQHRLTYDVHDTQELLTFDEAKALGGHVKRGAKAIPVSQPKVGAHRGFETVFKFLGRDCEGLPEGRYRGRPLKANPNDSESMDMFVRATEDADLEDLDAVGEWAFSQRYGLLQEGDALPAVPDVSDLKALVEDLAASGSRLKEACRRVDQSLKFQRHPEWAEEQSASLAQEPTGRGWDVVKDMNAAGDGYAYVREDGWSATVGMAEPDGEPDGTWGYVIYDSDNSVVYVTGGGYYDNVSFGSAEEAMGAAEVALAQMAAERAEEQDEPREWGADELRDYIEENGTLPQDYFDSFNREHGGELDMESATRIAKVGLGLTTAAAAVAAAPSAEEVRASVRQARTTVAVPEGVAAQAHEAARAQTRGV